MGEDVPFAFKALLLAKKILLINEIYYNYRINPASLTGVSTLKPIVLYEKCFVAARLVYDVMQYIPKNNDALMRAIKNMIRSITYMYPKYLAKMSVADRELFSKICRKYIIKDLCLFRVIGRKYKMQYIKCLLNR